MAELETQANILNENFISKSIKGVVFDLDDTLINTNEPWVGKMREFVSFIVSNVPGTEFGNVWDKLVKENNRAYKEIAVRETKWDLVVERLKPTFEDKFHETLDEGLNILREVYTLVPEVNPGTFEALRHISGIGAKLGLVTHARPEWTRLKLEGTGLNSFFSLDENVYVVDEKVHKGPKHWREGLEMLELKPEEVVVVGDSLPGDIIAAYDIGVRHLYRMPSIWSAYAEGDIPDGVFQIDGINELIEAMVEHLT